MLPNSFYEISTTLIQKPDTRKENQTAVSVMNTHVQIPNNSGNETIIYPIFQILIQVEPITFSQRTCSQSTNNVTSQVVLESLPRMGTTLKLALLSCLDYGKIPKLVCLSAVCSPLDPSSSFLTEPILTNNKSRSVFPFGGVLPMPFMIWPTACFPVSFQMLFLRPNVPLCPTIYMSPTKTCCFALSALHMKSSLFEILSPYAIFVQ